MCRHRADAAAWMYLASTYVDRHRHFRLRLNSLWFRANRGSFVRTYETREMHEVCNDTKAKIYWWLSHTRHPSDHIYDRFSRSCVALLRSRTEKKFLLPFHCLNVPHRYTFCTRILVILSSRRVITVFSRFSAIVIEFKPQLRSRKSVWSGKAWLALLQNLVRGKSLRTKWELTYRFLDGCENFSRITKQWMNVGWRERWCTAEEDARTCTRT